MSDRSKPAHAENRRTKAAKVVFRGSGAALLGNNPSIRTKADANSAIAMMLGKRPSV